MRSHILKGGEQQLADLARQYPETQLPASARPAGDLSRCVGVLRNLLSEGPVREARLAEAILVLADSLRTAHGGDLAKIGPVLRKLAMAKARPAPELVWEKAKELWEVRP